MDGIDRTKLDDFIADVGNENGLTGHGRNRFRTMTRTVLQRLEPMIQASVDERVAEKLGAERERITKILDAPQAKGREATARRLALASEVSFEQAIEILSTTPKTGLRGRTPLDAAMQSQTETVRDSDGTESWSDEDRAAHRILTAGE
jgi:phage I-like protein